MTPKELQAALRGLLPASYGVFDPYDDGTVEVGTPFEMPDGGGINVSVGTAGGHLEVTEDGWHTSRWFLMHVGMEVPAEIMSQVGAVASSANVQRTGLALSIRDLQLDQVPEAIDRLALTIRQIGDLVYPEAPADSEAATAAAD